MSLKSTLSRGDWVRAEASNGSVIEGQAGHDMATFGSPMLTLVVAGDDERRQTFVVDVNVWDVAPLRRNLLPED